MPIPIDIRLATLADAPDMAEIHMRSWEAAYKDIIPAAYIREKNATRPALWERILSGENTTRYIIRSGGKAVGFVCVGPSEDDDVDDSFYDLHGLYLHPDYYRKGIGTQAMAFALDLARGRGKIAMTVWVFAGNANAIAFYEAAGFTPDGKIDTRDFGKIMECVRLRREL